MSKLSDRLASEMAARNMNQAEFADFIGEPQPELTRWLKGSPVPGPDTWWKIAFRLGIPAKEAADLLKKANAHKERKPRVDYDSVIKYGYEHVLPEARKSASASNVVPMPVSYTPRDLPPQNVGEAVPYRPGAKPFAIYGYAAGSADGKLVMDVGAIGWETCPVELERIENAYGLLVDGDSMADRYRHGTRLHINPNAPFRPGDGVVVQIEEKASGRWYGYVKEYVGKTDDELIVRQYNPPGELRFNLIEVVSVHRVVGTVEP